MFQQRNQAVDERARRGEKDSFNVAGKRTNGANVSVELSASGLTCAIVSCVILDGDTADEEAHVQMSREEGDGSGATEDF